jgi:hypothetical protein
MAEGLLLSGQRAVPARALATDFVFAYDQVEAALANLFGGAEGGRQRIPDEAGVKRP